MGNRKTKARQRSKTESIYFTDPEDGERKETKNARKKLKVSMEAAMPCKMGTKRSPKWLQDTASETRKVASVESG